MKSKTFLISFFIICCLLYCGITSMNKKASTSTLSSSKDTLYINDSLYQVVEYENKIIKSIRLVDKSKNEQNKDQTVDFYSNGILNKVRIVLNVTLDTFPGYKAFVYKENQLDFTDMGYIKKAMLQCKDSFLLFYPHSK